MRFVPKEAPYRRHYQMAYLGGYCITYLGLLVYIFTCEHEYVFPPNHEVSFPFFFFATSSENENPGGNNGVLSQPSDLHHEVCYCCAGSVLVVAII